MPAVIGALALAAVLLAGCGDDGGDDTTSSTTTALEETTTSTDASGPETTTEPDAPATPDEGDEGGGEGASGGLSPGDPCSLEEGSTDCIDPEGDGEGVYLIGGGDCVAGAPDPGLCADLDGDGNAGYPDGEGDDPGNGETADLPECGADVPLPCRNPDGTVSEP